MFDAWHRSKFGELVKTVVWDNVRMVSWDDVMTVDDEETDDEPDADEREFEYDCSGLRKYHELYGWPA